MGLTSVCPFPKRNLACVWFRTFSFLMGEGYILSRNYIFPIDFEFFCGLKEYPVLWFYKKSVCSVKTKHDFLWSWRRPLLLKIIKHNDHMLWPGYKFRFILGLQIDSWGPFPKWTLVQDSFIVDGHQHLMEFTLSRKYIGDWLWNLAAIRTNLSENIMYFLDIKLELVCKKK